MAIAIALIAAIALLLWWLRDQQERRDLADFEEFCQTTRGLGIGLRLTQPSRGLRENWHDRPEAVAADGREVRCYVPLDRRAA